MQGFTRHENEFDEITAGMYENGSRSDQFLENEPLSTEKAGAEFFDQCDAQLHAGLGEQKRIALRHNALPRREIECLDAPRITSREPDFTGAVRAKVREKQRFPGNGSTERAEQLLPDALSAHSRLPLHAGGFINHLPSFGVNFLSRFEAHARHLQVIALNGVIERFNDWQRGGAACSHRPPAAGTKIGLVRDLRTTTDAKCHREKYKSDAEVKSVTL